uniref:Integrase core domain-containing protein n=3 Tax=Candidatus Kentrum eta TaxID=2126337 RepID=A0A450VHY1_9GAMM|nr:MAG: Integrase core domain-containing protein [Candidatus Kentron sp. H]VFK04838.1 MAG: Integrase core domain-containing protein [Candidatus Kentron sp. H]VFK06410.1 MAG: Integrase core domain-containing protein [Candidatus Kentron sp. H]
MRSIWLRHGLACFKKRLCALEEKIAKEGIILTEAQVTVLERKKYDDQVSGEIETEHPGYLGSQDTFYVGTLKGVRRIYQQTLQHDYQLYLALNDVEHTKTKVNSPQTNGICERFHKTILQEFYQVAFRKNLYTQGNRMKLFSN